MIFIPSFIIKAIYYNADICICTTVLVDRHTRLANRFQQKEPQKQNYDLFGNRFRYISEDYNFDSYVRNSNLIRSLKPPHKQKHLCQTICNVKILRKFKA
jgi:hypothetical protein